MAYTGFFWECNCGHVELSEIPPEECPSCYSINSFVQLPEEIVAEREKDMAEKMREEALSLENPESLLKPKKRSIKKKSQGRKRK